MWSDKGSRSPWGGNAMKPLLPRFAPHAASAAAVLTASLILPGCTATLPHAVLIPGETERVTAYFNRGAPFAVVRDADRTTVAAIEPAVVAREGYLRLWMLVQNESSSAQRIDPLRELSMRLRIESRGEDREIRPTRPGDILDKMHAEGPGLPSQRFEKVVATAEDESGLWMEAYRRDTRRHGSERAMLKQETILPGGVAHGFVYFPVPMRFRIAAGESLSGGQVFLGPKDGPRSLDDFHIMLRMSGPETMNEIAFEPAEAE